MGPSKVCTFEASKQMFLLFVPLLIGTGLSGAWILKYEIQIFHLDQFFLMIPMPLGMGPSGALNIWRQYEVQSRALEEICLVVIPLPMGMGGLYIWSIKLNIIVSFELMLLLFVPLLLWEDPRLLPFQKQYCTYWSFWIKLLGGGWARFSHPGITCQVFSILVFVTYFLNCCSVGEVALGPMPIGNGIISSKKTSENNTRWSLCSKLLQIH